MHRASYRFMSSCGITETLSDVESVRVVHEAEEIIMEKKNTVSDVELKEVTGGANSYASTARFSVGDKVTLIVYPEFGIGVVKSVYMKNGSWYCTVFFDAGIMDASDIEFAPA